MTQLDSRAFSLLHRSLSDRIRSRFNLFPGIWVFMIRVNLPLSIHFCLLKTSLYQISEFPNYQAQIIHTTLAAALLYFLPKCSCYDVVSIDFNATLKPLSF